MQEIICIGCNKLVKECDFFGNSVCYSCVYRKKREIFNRKSFCKICRKEIARAKASYCSDVCRVKGKALHNKNYWANNLPHSVSWNNSIFMKIESN